MLLSIAETVHVDDINTLYAGLQQYIELCGRAGLLIGNNACYMALGVSRSTICAWLNGTRRQHNPEYRKFAEFVKAVCAAAREQYGIEGITSPLMTIWLQKQYDGFVDTPPREEARNPLGELVAPKQLERKYYNGQCSVVDR